MRKIAFFFSIFIPWGLPQVVVTVQQMHCSRQRLVGRRLGFHLCNINKNAHTKISGNSFNVPRIIFTLFYNSDSRKRDWKRSFCLKINNQCGNGYWRKTLLEYLKSNVRVLNILCKAIYIYIYIYVYIYIYIYTPTPLYVQDKACGHFLSAVKQIWIECSFS